MREKMDNNFFKNSQNPEQLDINLSDGELENYDLLEHHLPNSKLDIHSAHTDLSSTAKAFNTRIQRKKREQQEANEQSEKAAHHRHSLMLEALMNIRKALRQVARIDLGERFSFFLVADDFGAWPRLIVKLKDHQDLVTNLPSLVVTAHDRHESGTIEVGSGPGTPSEKLNLQSETEVSRVPNFLRKCVRTYLDHVAEVVLAEEGRKVEFVNDDYIEQYPGDYTAKDNTENATSELTSDLFEDNYEPDFLETLPTYSESEELTGKN